MLAPVNCSEVFCSAILDKLSQRQRDLRHTRLVRWISGTFISSSSLRKAFSVNRRQQVPGPVRPARPLRWLAAARLSGYTCASRDTCSTGA